MNTRIQFCLIVAAIVVVFDAVAAAVSKAFLIDYTKMALINYILYVAAGFFGRKSFDLKTGVAAGFLAGLADATIGWYLSSVIAPFVPFAQPNYSALLVILIIILITGAGGFLAYLGASLFQLLHRSESPADRDSSP
jgi:hypothetical protein